MVDRTVLYTISVDMYGLDCSRIEPGESFTRSEVAVVSAAIGRIDRIVPRALC